MKWQRTAAVFYLLIAINALAGRPIPVKESELPALIKSAEHIFEAEFLEHQQTYFHRDHILTGDELAAYLELKDAELEDIIFTYLGKDGTRYSQEYMSKFPQTNDPFEQENSSDKPEVVDALYKLKNSEFEFSFYNIKIRDRITLKITQSIKGQYRSDTEQDFDFYRDDSKSCHHIAQIGDFTKKQKYFLIPTNDDHQHQYDFRIIPLPPVEKH